MSRTDQPKASNGFIFLILALLFSGCRGGTSTPSPQPSMPASPSSPLSPLAGTQWLLVSMNGQLPVNGSHSGANFTQEDISGKAGCNSYEGSYQANSNSLAIQVHFSTEMACVEPVGLMEQEQAFLDALHLVTTFRLSQDRLELLDASGDAILVFAPRLPEPTFSLENTNWVLEAIIEGPVTQHAVQMPNIRLRFNSGLFESSAGCNTYQGAYTLSGQALSIENLQVVQVPCNQMDEDLSLQSQYFDILAQVKTFQIDGSRLLLQTAGDRGLQLQAEKGF